MDELTFDRLARALGDASTRRRLLRLIAALPVVGVALAGADGAEAERPRDRLHRHKAQRRRKQRTRKRQNNNNGNGGGGNNNSNKNNKNPGGGLGGSQCGATGSACTKNSDCCSSTCFSQVCATAPTQCGNEICPAGSNGCCGGLCCQSPANQCNALGQCCAPNCAGRQCGTDGCGNSGTCGACLPGQTCSADGQCQGMATCGPQTCNGCCDATGACRTGNTPQVCGTGGVACASCPTGLICNATTHQCSPDCDVCPTCAYTTVQAAVADPNGPSTIRLCPGTYTENLSIGRSLTLIGAGQGAGAGNTLLQGTGLNTVVWITPSTAPVTLQGLRITNGGSPGGTINGGGVLHEGLMLTMIDCTVTRNVANSLGGGIAAGGPGSMALTGCTITENQVDVDDPENTATGCGLALGLTGTVTMTNCTVSANSGEAENGVVGGGIFLDQGTLTLDNTIVTGNTAVPSEGEPAGGGLFNAFGTLNLLNGSSITGNTPDDCANATGTVACSSLGSP